jgi:predicted nuclease with TOPRIM domain
MSTGDLVGIIIATIALVGVIIQSQTTARKDAFDELSKLYDKLKEKVDELEAENLDLKDWAERLVCQVKGAGMNPVEFIRRNGRDKP